MLKRYKLDAELGAGGMGAVYRATDRLTGEVVALKQVHLPPLALDFSTRGGHSNPDELRVALAREFQMLASLRHPHIIQVLDYGFDSRRQPYYTMNLLRDARPITEAATNRSVTERLELLIQLMQALAYLHRRRILHRDLKPSNVLVTPDNQVKVLDFGLAVRAGQMARLGGTVAYMAPEVLGGQLFSEQADCFAAGLIAYQMFTGRHPFQRHNIVDLMQAIVRATPDLGALPGLRVEELFETQPVAKPDRVSLDRPVPTMPAGDDLNGIIGRLLMKNPTQRYHRADAALDDLLRLAGQPRPAQAIAIRESFLQAATFVGRRTEIGTLMDAIQRARGGQGSLWLVGGESGVGKSRLLNEIRVRAMVEGCLVLEVMTVPGLSGAERLWRQLLPHLVLAAPISDPQAAILKELVPGIETLLERPVGTPPLVDARQHLQRLSETVLAVVRAACAQQTLVVLLDDLQWATDFADDAALGAVLSNIETLPLTAIGAYRDDERPTLPEELPSAQVLHLERLTRAEMDALSSAMLGDPSVEVQDFLARHTEGNVFFLVEVIRALAEEAGSLSNIGMKTLPETIIAAGIEQLVQRRLAHVPEWLQPIMKLAAVAGRELDLDLLAHMVGPQIVEQWLRVGADAAVLALRDNQWDFAHAKLQEGVLAALAPAESAALNHVVAEAIETLHPDDLAYAEVLVGHWRAAGEVEREVEHLLRLAERWLARGNFELCHSRLEEALTRVRDPRQRLSMLVALAEANDRLSRFQDALDHCARGMALAADLNDRASMAHLLRRQGSVAWQQGDMRRAYQLIQEALVIWGELDDTQGQMSCYNALGVVAMGLNALEEAHESLQHSLMLARQVKDQRMMATNLSNLGLVARRRDQLDTALAYYLESFGIVAELEDSYGQMIVLINIGAALSDLGEYAQAEVYNKRGLELAQQLGNQFAVAATLENLGMDALHQDRLAEARLYFSQALTVARTHHLRSRVANALGSLARVAARQGRPAEAQQLLCEALHSAAQDDGWQLPNAFVAEVAEVLALVGAFRAAAGFLALVKGHLPPVVQRQMARTRQQAEAALGSAVVAAIMEVDKPSADDVVRRFLQECDP